jgi:hypothetical protein
MTARTVREVARAITDSERMDWLEANPFELRGGCESWSVYPHAIIYLSARKAIDAAIRAYERERKKKC